MKAALRTFCITCLSLAGISTALAQQKADGVLADLLRLQDTLRMHLPIERVYVQTDKPFYAVGDTIWLKAYVFNADYLHNSTRSGLLYIELTNDSANVVNQMVLPLTV